MLGKHAHRLVTFHPFGAHNATLVDMPHRRVVPPTSAVELGVRIKTAMFRQGVSGQQLGDALGIGRSTVSQKLHGRVSITVPELLVICEVLDVDVADILAGLDAEPPEQQHESSSGHAALLNLDAG